MIHGSVELPEDIEYILRKFPDSVIAGSYPLSLLYEFEPNDIDIFTKNNVSIPEELERLGWTIESKHLPSDKYDWHVTTLVKEGNTNIQVIGRNCLKNRRELLDQLFQDFDLSVCEIGIYWDGEPVLYSSEDWDKYTPNGEIKNPFCRTKSQTKTAARVHKYAKRGFKKLVEPMTDGWWKLVPKKDGLKCLYKGRDGTANVCTYPLEQSDAP